MIGLQMEEEEALGKMMLEVVVEVGLLVSLLWANSLDRVLPLAWVLPLLVGDFCFNSLHSNIIHIVGSGRLLLLVFLIKYFIFWPTNN